MIPMFRFLAVGVLLVSLSGGSCDESERGNSVRQVPSSLVERLTATLREKFPELEVIVEDVPDTYQVGFAFKCRKYMEHNLSGIGPNNGFVKSREHVGPSAGGFLLLLRWQASIDGGQGYGLAPLYCNHIHNIYMLPGHNGYVVMSLDLGSKTNMSVMEMVHTELTAVGKPSYDLNGPTRRDECERLRVGLVKVMSKHGVQADWRTQGDVVIGAVNTFEFDIHSVESDGEVSMDVQKQIGPDRNGFIIRLVPQSKLPRGRTRSLFELKDTAYWSQYSARCRACTQPIRVEIDYGESADKKLLKALINELNAETSVFPVASPQ